MIAKTMLKILAYLISRIIYQKNRLIWKYPASPGKIIWVTPGQMQRSIEYTSILNHKRYYLDGVIAGGNWGKRQSKVSKTHSDLFESFDQYFNKSVPLEETGYFTKKRGKSAAKKYKLKYEPIYRQIKEEGFKIPTSVFDSVEPFKVSIASNGDIMFMTGKHRLAIAKTFGDDFSIPALVSFRHTEWQKKREYILSRKGKNIKDEYQKYLTHPDIASELPGAPD
ncbi:hypothetical protein BH23BAC3_BH23BAC3_34650 [soil metagenome]